MADNIAHAHCMLDTYSYKHTLRIWYIIAFLLQQWLHERATMLRYTHTARLAMYNNKARLPSAS